MRAILYENKYSKTNTLKFKNYFQGHAYDGMIYSTGINSTYQQFPVPPNCPYLGEYKLDTRCRYYYEPTIKNTSIIIYDPQPIYTQGFFYLSSTYCKRILKYEKNFPDSIYQVYSILCKSLDLSVIPQYFQNFGSSSKYQIFLDPRKLTVVFHSKIQLSKTNVSTIQEFETQYLEDQEEASKFLKNINSFNQLILEESDKILNDETRTKISQKTFEYNRNGTECFVIINLVTMVDKVPKFEYLKSVNPSHKYQIKGAYLFLDILSKEIMTQYSDNLKKKIKIWGLSALMLGFQIYYSYILGKNLMHPVMHLTHLLKTIRFLNQKKQDLQGVQGNDEGDKKSRGILEDIQSEDTEQNCMIQFDENLDKVNFDGFCYSSDTQVLLYSFQNLFKILKFTTHNFYNENNTVSLLNLNIQIQHFDQFGNYRALGVCHNNIGVIHYNCGRFNEAMESFQKALIYAKYELNVYSHEYTESASQYNSIKTNSANMRSTLMQKTNTFESVTCKQGTLTNLDKQKSKPNFFKKDVGDISLLQIANSEMQQLYWNLYNRNQNYVKALFQYLNLSDNQSPNMSNMWDLFQDIAIENATISSLYLPQSIKREMFDCYLILMASFKQNFFDETSYLLHRFNSLYIKHFQQKNYIRNICEYQNSSNPSPNITNFQNNAQISQSFNVKSQTCILMNEIYLQKYQLTQDSINHSLPLLFAPLHLPKLDPKNKQYQNQKYNRKKQTQSPALQKQIQSMNHLNSHQLNLSKNEIILTQDKSKLNLNKQEVEQIEEDNIYSVQDQQNSFSSYQNQMQIMQQQHSNTGTFQQANYISNIYSSRSIPHNDQANRYQQYQNIGILRKNSSDNYKNKNVSKFSQNDKGQQQLLKCKIAINNSQRNDKQDLSQMNNISILSSRGLILGAKQNNLSYDEEQDGSKSPIHKYIKTLTSKRKDPQFDQIENKYNKDDSIIVKNLNNQKNSQNNNLSNQDINKNNNQTQKQEFFQSENNIPENKIQKQQSPFNSSNLRTISQNKKQQIKGIELQNKQISKDEFEIKKYKKKINIFYKIRKVEKREKLAVYEYSSDIYFQYYALQLAKFEISCKNYLNASIILTNAVEQSKYYLPHLKFQIIQKLSSIFQSQNLNSPELDYLQHDYCKLLNSNQSVCVISSCQTINSQAITFKVCSDVINEILFQKNDCFGLIKYCFKEGIYLQQMGLTDKQTIKSAPKFFQNIITPSSSSSKAQKYVKQIILNNSKFKEFKFKKNEKKRKDSIPVLKLPSNVMIDFKSQDQKEQNFYTFSSSLEIENSLREDNNLVKDNKQIVNRNQNFTFNFQHLMKQSGYNNESNSPKVSQFQQNKKNHFNKRLQEEQLNHQIIQENDVNNLTHDKNILVQKQNSTQIVNNQVDDNYHLELAIKEQNAHPQSDNPLFPSSLNLISHDHSQTQIASNQNSYINILQKQHNSLDHQSESSPSNFKNQEKIQDFYKEGYQLRNIKNMKSQNKLEQKNIPYENTTTAQIQNSIKQSHQQAQNIKSNLKIKSEENVYTNVSEDKNINNQSFNFNIPICQIQNKDNRSIDNSAEKQKKYKINGEEVFHQGIHAALKYFILNSEEKLSCYLSYNKFKANLNYQLIPNKSQKTYLVYISDQILTLNNKYFLKELSDLLWNLDLELLILVLNQNQAFEEFSSLNNIFLNKKPVISFFQSEEKMLQYIYNMREHVKNNIDPMIVEHF